MGIKEKLSGAQTTRGLLYDIFNKNIMRHPKSKKNQPSSKKQSNQRNKI